MSIKKLAKILLIGNYSVVIQIVLLPSYEEELGEVNLNKFSLSPNPSPSRERGLRNLLNRYLNSSVK